jgi:hypothetical protein
VPHYNFAIFGNNQNDFEKFISLAIERYIKNYCCLDLRVESQVRTVTSRKDRHFTLDNNPISLQPKSNGKIYRMQKCPHALAKKCVQEQVFALFSKS